MTSQKRNKFFTKYGKKENIFHCSKDMLPKLVFLAFLRKYSFEKRFFEIRFFKNEIMSIPGMVSTCVYDQPLQKEQQQQQQFNFAVTAD